MKNLQTTIVLFFLGIIFSFSQSTIENDSISNFSLEAALAMFKKATTLEEFEKLINLDNNSVNNLDLNNDENIDYVSVNSIKNNHTHVIVLQTWISETEIQDIATIEIEKTNENEAQLQIIGDETIFGENAIAEPFDVLETIEKSKGPSYPKISVARVLVNAWFWPCVKFVYAPNYIVYTSPFKWRKYPNWWKPWKPAKIAVFHSRVIVYRNHFHRTSSCLMMKAKKFYTPRRSHSILVAKNNRGTIVARKGKREKTTVLKSRR